MDQIPAAAPIPQAWKVAPAGAPQTAMAMMIVTMAPMITTSQAVTRMTARSTSNKASGSSATRVLPRVELTGLSCWVKSVAARNMEGNLPLRWLAPFRSLLRDKNDRSPVPRMYAICCSPRIPTGGRRADRVRCRLRRADQVRHVGLPLGGIGLLPGVGEIVLGPAAPRQTLGGVLGGEPD